MPIEIFLSHAHDDRAIADALQTLLVDDLFGATNVVVQSSSDQSSQGGIKPGVPWRDWIDQHINDATLTIAVLTPLSRTSQWVLWESGAAYAAGLLKRGQHSVMPVTFALEPEAVPGPLAGNQVVRGDADGVNGIMRLLQHVNEVLAPPSGLLPKKAFDATTKDVVPAFIAKVKAAVIRSGASILEAIPAMVNTAAVAGQWVTAYDFVSEGVTRYHADIATITAVDRRRFRATNRLPPPVTQGHRHPFTNEIQAEIVGRHVIGQWRNVSDARYYGSLHLAILTEESIMEGHYTAVASTSDLDLAQGSWRWVRLDPASLERVDLTKFVLKDPAVIHAAVRARRRDDGPIALDAVAQPTT